MSQILKIVVQVPDRNKAGNFIELFRNSIELDSSMVYDFQSMIKGLHLLFPNKQLIINLTLM